MFLSVSGAATNSGHFILPTYNGASSCLPLLRRNTRQHLLHPISQKRPILFKPPTQFKLNVRLSCWRKAVRSNTHPLQHIPYPYDPIKNFRTNFFIYVSCNVSNVIDGLHLINFFGVTRGAGENGKLDRLWNYLGRANHPNVECCGFCDYCVAGWVAVDGLVRQRTLCRLVIREIGSYTNRTLTARVSFNLPQTVVFLIMWDFFSNKDDTPHRILCSIPCVFVYARRWLVGWDVLRLKEHRRSHYRCVVQK